MSIFIPINYYAQILNEVGHFKIISMKDLYEKLRVDISYSLFCRKVKKLEYEGMIRSLIGMRKAKLLTLTSKGSEYSNYGSQYSESEKELNHDLIATNVMLNFEKTPKFRAASVIHSTDQVGIESDGLVYFRKEETEFLIGIEVELTQKSRSRINQKFIDYSNSKNIDHAIFIFNKESVFRSYQRVLDSLVEEVRRKILLILDEDLSSIGFNLLTKEVYYKCKYHTFTHVFGIDQEKKGFS